MVEKFTPEELAEMAAFDAELDEEDTLALTDEEIAESKARDADAKLEDLSHSEANARKSARKRESRERNAQRCREYYAAHKEEQYERLKAWRAENRQLVNDYQRRYDIKRRKEASEERHNETNARQRAYYAAHREERLAHQRAYNAAHREEINARMRAWRAAHPEEACARNRDYYARNRERILSRLRERRDAAKMNKEKQEHES